MILLDLLAVIPPDEIIDVHVPGVGNIQDKCVDIYFNPHFLEILIVWKSGLMQQWGQFVN